MPEPAQPNIKTPSSPSGSIQDSYEQEFGSTKTEGEQAVEFVDAQRQEAARDTSKSQEEDLKKSLGTGFTFGALNVANSAPPEVYLNRAKNYSSNDRLLDTARKFTSNQLTVPGSATRRFAKPLAIGSATMYAGSRAVDSLLDEESKVNYGSDQSMNNNGPTGTGPNGITSGSIGDDNYNTEKQAKSVIKMDDAASWLRSQLKGGGGTKNVETLEDGSAVAPHKNDNISQGDSGPSTEPDIETLEDGTAVAPHKNDDVSMPGSSSGSEASEETNSLLGRQTRNIMIGGGALGAGAGGFALSQEKTSSLNKEGKPKFLDDMADFFRKSDSGGPTQNSSSYENAPHLNDTRESYDNVPHPNDPYFDEAVNQAESQMGQPNLQDIEQIRRGIEEQNRGFFDRLSDGFEKSKDQASEAGKTITGIGGAGLAGGAGYLGYNAYMDNGPKSTGEEVAYNISNKPSTRVGRQVASSPSGVRSQRPQLDRRRTKQAEKKIEKKADDESILDFNEKQENYGLMAGGSAVGGAGASMLDPRTTLYHGTSPYNKEKIQSEGFKSNLNENNALDDVDRTFLTPRPYKNDIARSWEAKNSPPGASRGDGLVKSRIPLWKRDYITNNKLWKSPTMTRLPDDIEEKVKKIAPSPRIGIEGDISPEYVKGQNYSGPNMSEFSEYIKETPKGKAGAGAALLGGGLAAYGLSEEADRRTKEAASEDGFSTEEKDMAQDISVGVAGAGAASGLVGSYGPDAIRGSNPLSQEGIDRFKDFADNSPYDKSSREFMQDYARSGSKLLGNELIDTPVGSATGAEAVESLKNIDKQKRTQMLGRAGNMFADPDSADDPRLSHYTEFGKGQLPALAQMHADSSELADNGPISDPIEDFKSDVVGAQEAAKEKLDGTPERNPEEYKRLMTSEMEDSFGRADQSDVRGLVDNIVNSDASSIEEEIPGKDETGRSVHDVSKQNFVRQAQDLGYDVSSFEDIEKMSPNVQREIMESNATGDVWQNWATLKGNRSFRPKPRTYRNSVVPALQEMSDRFDNAASRFGKNVSPAMIRGGAGLAAAGAAGAGAIEYMGEDKTGANKMAGGPGSGVEHNNTDEITRLEKSPKITIHRREKIKAQRDPDRKKEIQISSIDYAAQSKYNIEKLSWFLKNWPEWKDSRIDVALMDGEYHLMDGHHRYLAADRLQKESLPANVWIVSEDEVDQIVKSAEKDHSFNVGDTFYSKANNEHIEIVSMSGQMATVSSEGNSWKEPVDVMKYKTQNGHWKQMSEKKASVSALGQPVLYKNAKGEEEDMETGTKALYAGAGTVGAGGGYNAARAIGKGIRVNNAQSKYLNRVQETDNNLAKPSAEELGRNENFYGQVKNAPGREAGNSLIRPSMNLLSNKPGSDIVIESGGSGDVVAPTFMHELGHYKNFEESNYNQFGEYIGEKDLKGKDSGIVSDLMGSNEKSPLLQEEEKAWSKARDIAERNNMSGSMDAPTRRFALDTYKNLQELGRYGRNTGRLLPVAAGLGLAGSAAKENGWFDENKKEASSYKLGQPKLQKEAEKDYRVDKLNKKAARNLSDLERDGDWVKYRGEWYPLDKPVESWRKGKKRAVLASKEEDGQKKVKMVHYGSSNHEHNYSDKAKQNYLSRAKGITNQKGEKTKDDPHSANHWSIKDLWPEDQEADGSEKFNAYTPNDDSRFMSEKTGSSNSSIIVDRENPGRVHRMFAQSDSEPIDDKDEYKSRASEAFEREYGTQPENVKTEMYHGSGSAVASRTDPISSLPEEQQRKAISGYKSDVYTDRGLPGGMMIGGIAGGLAPLGGGKTRVATSMLGSMLGGAAGAEISRSMAPSPQDVDVDEYLRRHDRSSISKESEDKNNRFSRTINMVGRFPKSANDTSLPDGIDAPETEVNFDTGEIGENMSFDMDMPDIETPDDASIDMPEPAYTVTPGTDPNEADENPVSADLQNVKQNPA